MRAARERDVDKMVSLYDPEVRVDGGGVGPRVAGGSGLVSLCSKPEAQNRSEMN